MDYLVKRIVVWLAIHTQMTYFDMVTFITPRSYCFGRMGLDIALTHQQGLQRSLPALLQFRADVNVLNQRRTRL